MRSGMLFFVGLLVGGGLFAVAQVLLRTADEPAEPDALVAPADLDALSSSVLDKLVVRLDRIERRLDDAVFARGPSSGDGPQLKGTPGAKAPSSETAKSEAVAIDADSLAEALEQIEDRKWAAMSDDDVRSAAQRLMKGGNLAGAHKALERLLGRDLEPEAEAEVLTQLGIVQRAHKDFEGSAATLREAIRVVGLDSQQGVQAGMQLAWTLSKSEDRAGALRVAEDVIRAPSSEGQLRTNMRWGVGVLSALQGDSARARQEFERVISEARTDPKLEGLARDAQRRIDELR